MSGVASVLAARDALRDMLMSAALAGGREISAVRAASPDIATVHKPDGTPVTEADTRAETAVNAMLRASYPDIPIVAEEEIAAGASPDISGGCFFLVDALDGTKAFLRGGKNFTVNIGLVLCGAPIAGVVYAPAHGLLYMATGGIAEKIAVCPLHTPGASEPIACRTAPAEPVAVAGDTPGGEDMARFIKERGIGDVRYMSSSLKFCIVAEGEADIYPRLGRTMQWDTAAGDAVLRAAGGKVICSGGEPFLYGARKDDFPGGIFANPHFIAAGHVPGFPPQSER